MTKYHKLFLLFPIFGILLGFILSCGKKEPVTELQTREVIDLSDYKIVIIDSCEYIERREDVNIAQYRVLGISSAHRGQCHFCKERRMKEYQEALEIFFSKEEK